MKIYLVERTDSVDYDEYDSFVVVAENEEKAVEICSDSMFTKFNTKVEEVMADAEERIILGSYNAG